VAVCTLVATPADHTTARATKTDASERRKIRLLRHVPGAQWRRGMVRPEGTLFISPAWMPTIWCPPTCKAYYLQHLTLTDLTTGRNPQN
jgi:hypothetical protein